MKSYGSPTLRRRILGAELRRLREERGVSQLFAADEVGLTRNALSRYENAESSMLPIVAKQLFSYYDVSGAELEALLDLVRGSRKRGWLKDVRDVVPEWFAEYIAMERDASQVKEFCLATVPGYLQTEDYAREVLSNGTTTQDVDENVNVRLSRGKYLQRGESPNVQVILHEAVLRTLVGGTEVMTDQLRWLAKQATRDNIEIRVLPFSAGAHPAMLTSFTILRFPDFPHFGVVYIDYITGSLYRDEGDEVSLYADVYGRLLDVSMAEAQSLKLIRSLTRG